jgi:hypothetical protein
MFETEKMGAAPRVGAEQLCLIKSAIEFIAAVYNGFLENPSGKRWTQCKSCL